LPVGAAGPVAGVVRGCRPSARRHSDAPADLPAGAGACSAPRAMAWTAGLPDHMPVVLRRCRLPDRAWRPARPVATDAPLGAHQLGARWRGPRDVRRSALRGRGPAGAAVAIPRVAPVAVDVPDCCQVPAVAHGR